MNTAPPCSWSSGHDWSAWTDPIETYFGRPAIQRRHCKRKDCNVYQGRLVDQ